MQTPPRPPLHPCALKLTFSPANMATTPFTPVGSEAGSSLLTGSLTSTTFASMTLYKGGRSMETREVKSTSRRARLWARLLDQDKPPRCWWFPPSSRQDGVLQMPEAARQDYRRVVEQTHAKFSEGVQPVMLSLLSFALFCLLIKPRQHLRYTGGELRRPCRSRISPEISMLPITRF